MKKYSEYIGLRTNNQAEYEALIAALKYASRQPSQEVICYIDSELVVKQLNGKYRVRDPKLEALSSKVRKLEQDFLNTFFIHIPRTDTYIQLVDQLANQALSKAGYNR